MSRQWGAMRARSALANTDGRQAGVLRDGGVGASKEPVHTASMTSTTTTIGRSGSAIRQARAQSTAAEATRLEAAARPAPAHVGERSVRAIGPVLDPARPTAAISATSAGETVSDRSGADCGSTVRGHAGDAQPGRAA